MSWVCGEGLTLSPLFLSRFRVGGTVVQPEGPDWGVDLDELVARRYTKLPPPSGSEVDYKFCLMNNLENILKRL